VVPATAAAAAALAQDRDNSGTLERDELAMCLTMLGVEVQESHLDAIFGVLDVDGDGEVVIAEFFESMEQLKSELKAARKAAVHAEAKNVAARERLRRAEEARGTVSSAFFTILRARCAACSRRRPNGDCGGGGGACSCALHSLAVIESGARAWRACLLPWSECEPLAHAEGGSAPASRRRGSGTEWTATASVVGVVAAAPVRVCSRRQCLAEPSARWLLCAGVLPSKEKPWEKPPERPRDPDVLHGKGWKKLRKQEKAQGVGWWSGSGAEEVCDTAVPPPRSIEPPARRGPC
jgi:hypothetical protein